jgi:hypothetical protein
MLPFIQCHHTCGRALSGGFSNPLWSESGLLCAERAPNENSSTEQAPTNLIAWSFIVSPLLSASCASFFSPVDRPVYPDKCLLRKHFASVMYLSTVAATFGRGSIFHSNSWFESVSPALPVFGCLQVPKNPSIFHAATLAEITY